MKNIFILVITTILVISLGCQSKSSHQDTDRLLEIKEACAVILIQDSLEIDSIMKVHQQDVFVEIFSDVGYYNMMAKDDLTKRGIKVKEIDAEKMAFIHSDGKRTIIHRKRFDKDMIFFSPEKELLGTYTADYESDLSYFGDR